MVGVIEEEDEDSGSDSCASESIFEEDLIWNVI